MRRKKNRIFISRLLAVILVVCSLLSMTGCGKDDQQGTQTTPYDDPTVTFKPGKTVKPTRPAVPDTEADPDDEEPTDETEAPEAPSLGGFAVSSSCSEATWAGMQILSAGGNAVDAAVATAFTLGVCEPYSSGLGGSGVMLVYDSKTGKSYTLDYYACAGGSYSNDGTGVPGFLAGMQKALDLWGTYSLADAMVPAIDFAENGFPATSTFLMRLGYSSALRNNPAFANVSTGSTVVQTKLAQTLRTIQSEGISAFYGGSIGKDVANACALSLSDLENYEVRKREAVESEFSGYRILGGYAPASGMTVCQMLTACDLLNIPSPVTSPNGYLRAIKTATNVAYASRRSKLVDPDYYDFAGSDLTSTAYVQSLLGSGAQTYENDPEQFCTTQFAVIDSNGLIVCVTNTLSDSWGGYKLVDGFYLNNSLNNFSGSGLNSYEPGKRPRTHFAPVIAVGPNGELIAIGSPAGINIPKIVAQVLLNIIKFGDDVQTAIDKARVMYDEHGSLCIETQDRAASVISVSQVDQAYYYSSSHIYFGCTSVVGYSPDIGVFSACDRRRDTAQAMVYYYTEE